MEEGRTYKKEREEKKNKFAPDPLDRLLSPHGYCLPYSPPGIKPLVRLYHLAKLVGRGLCSSIRPQVKQKKPQLYFRQLYLYYTLCITVEGEA